MPPKPRRLVYIKLELVVVTPSFSVGFIIRDFLDHSCHFLNRLTLPRRAKIPFVVQRPCDPPERSKMFNPRPACPKSSRRSQPLSHTLSHLSSTLLSVSGESIVSEASHKFCEVRPESLHDSAGNFVYAQSQDPAFMLNDQSHYLTFPDNRCV